MNIAKLTYLVSEFDAINQIYAPPFLKPTVYFADTVSGGDKCSDKHIWDVIVSNTTALGAFLSGGNCHCEGARQLTWRSD